MHSNSFRVTLSSIVPSFVDVPLPFSFSAPEYHFNITRRWGCSELTALSHISTYALQIVQI